MRENFAAKLLKVVLHMIFVIGLFLTVTLPFMIEYYTGILYDAYYLQPGYRTFIILFLMGVGAIGLWIVLEIIGMLNTISTGPFIARNVDALRRIGIGCFAAAVLFFAKCVSYFTILTLLCGILLLVCGLFALTFCGLFRQAVRFKEENDLTI